MGCEFHWNAIEPDLTRQRQAGWLLQSIAQRNGWDYRVFNGPVEACFLYHPDWPPKEMQENPERYGVPGVEVKQDGLLAEIFPNLEVPDYPPPPPLSAHKTTLNLLGVSLFYETAVQELSDEESESTWNVARHQVSFVFNNTPTLPCSRANELVTIEFIKDIAWGRYALYQPAFDSIAAKPQTGACAILRPGSWHRLSIGQAASALELALALKQQCISALEAGDDYEIFKGLLARNRPISEEYLLSSTDPALRSFWGI